MSGPNTPGDFGRAVVAGALMGATFAGWSVLIWAAVELLRSWVSLTSLIAAGAAMGALYGWNHVSDAPPRPPTSWRSDK